MHTDATWVARVPLISTLHFLSLLSFTLWGHSLSLVHPSPQSLPSPSYLCLHTSHTAHPQISPPLFGNLSCSVCTLHSWWVAFTLHTGVFRHHLCLFTPPLFLFHRSHLHLSWAATLLCTATLVYLTRVCLSLCIHRTACSVFSLISFLNSLLATPHVLPRDISLHWDSCTHVVHCFVHRTFSLILLFLHWVSLPLSLLL